MEIRLVIVGTGNSEGEVNQSRGKKFEELIAEVMEKSGFKMSTPSNVNYAGMEIDVEGSNVLTGIPVYAECKFFKRPIESKEIQAFLGKYITRWAKDKRAQGVFLAIPSLNAHALGFYNENCRDSKEFSMSYFSENRVVELLCDKYSIGVDAIEAEAKKVCSSLGESSLVFLGRQIYLVSTLIRAGSLVPDAAMAFNADGSIIQDDAEIASLKKHVPSLEKYPFLKNPKTGAGASPTRRREGGEEVVEVKGSSSFFEYHYPASPSFLVGRRDQLKNFELFVEQVKARKTSSRSLLFEGNSGSGKSSVILKFCDLLNIDGNFGFSFDCRTAATDSFVLKVVSYVLKHLRTVAPTLGVQSEVVPSLENASLVLTQIGQKLSEDGKLLFIAFDQFESIFYKADVLQAFVDFLLKMSGLNSNIIVGFAWKSDLIGFTNEFPFELRDIISQHSEKVSLRSFGRPESSIVLDRLGDEINSKLREDLRFILEESAQGLPWLLKKLCAHTLDQRRLGKTQVDLASSMLNVSELFQQDVSDLSAREETALREIARRAPVEVQDLEQFDNAIIQSLVNKKLVIKVGNRYAIYWEIFQDFLNSGEMPVRDNYLLKLQVGSGLRMMKSLSEFKKPVRQEEFCKKAKVSIGTFFNVSRDLRLLGMIQSEDGLIRKNEAINLEDDNSTKRHLNAKLKDNRVVQLLLEHMAKNHPFTYAAAVSLLKNEICPYVSASDATWRTYVKSLADWMDAADLIIDDKRNGMLIRYEVSTEVRALRTPGKRGSSLGMPRIQFEPVREAASRILVSLRTGQRIAWGGMAKSTMFKALWTLEELEMIELKGLSIRVLDGLNIFEGEVDQRNNALIAKLNTKKMFQVLCEVLKEPGGAGKSIAEVGRKIREQTGMQWTDSTATVYAKLWLDWARKLGLADGKRKKKSTETQLEL